MPARCPRLIIRKARNLCGSGFLNGGGGGIRTHGTRERSTVFKTAPINRSGTPPDIGYILILCKKSRLSSLCASSIHIRLRQTTLKKEPNYEPWLIFFLKTLQK